MIIFETGNFTQFIYLLHILIKICVVVSFWNTWNVLNLTEIFLLNCTAKVSLTALSWLVFENVNVTKKR